MTVTLLSFEQFDVRVLNYSENMLPFFNPENFSFLSDFYSQIMTGEDSPTEKREEFNFGRSTPPPTTSHVTSSKQDYGDIKTVAEPHKEEKDKEKEKEDKEEKDDKDDIATSRPDANPGYNPEDSKKNDDVKGRDKDDRGSDRDKDREKKKINGSDVLDGQWIPAKGSEAKPHQDEEEDDNCTVKCLYYTMQCCECSIS